MNHLSLPALASELKRTMFMWVFLVGTLFLLSGCAGSGSSTGAQTSPSPSPRRTFSTADLKKVRWIEGTWRGTGGGVDPFCERYKFESDTVLAVEGLECDKLDKAGEVTRFELKNGEFGGGSGGSLYIATLIDDKSITFDPVTKARNSFRWERESENSWKAVLWWPATDKAKAGERTYQMERWPKQ
jgi:hypothetical protein